MQHSAKISNMSDTTDNKIFNQGVMRCGILLGMLWIAMYISCIASLANPGYVLLFIILYAASPFYAGYLTSRFRRRECNNILTYTQAWLFVMIMYLLASLLSAVAHFVYFLYIDKGFLINTMHEMIKVMDSQPELFAELGKEFKSAVDIYSTMSIPQIVLNFQTSNIINGVILSPIIALFVKRTPNINKENL